METIRDGELRSFNRFETEDLDALAAIAEQDLTVFIGRNPHHATLIERRMIVAMCQGAALHYVDGKNGVKDFDLWTFFAHDPQQPKYPVRRRGIARFDGARFDDSTRRVDLLGRTLSVPRDADPVVALRGYLAQGATQSARCLSRKAAVGLWPPRVHGQVLWPMPN